MNIRVLMIAILMVMSPSIMAELIDHGYRYLGHNIYKYELIFDEPQQNVRIITARNGQPDLNVDFSGSLQLKDNLAFYSFYKNDYIQGDQIAYRFEFTDTFGEINPAPSLGFDNHLVGSGGQRHLFSETFSQKMSVVELHILRNGETNEAIILTDTEIDHGDGSFTYGVNLNQFQDGDSVHYRIYGRTLDSNEMFIPGPTAAETRLVEFNDSTSGEFPIFIGQNEINGFEDVFIRLHESLFEFDMPLPVDTIFSIQPGVGYSVTENGIIPEQTGTLSVALSLSKDSHTSTFMAQVNVLPLDERDALVLTDRLIIENAGLTLRNVMDQLATQSGVSGVTGASLFKQLWDTQNTANNSSLPNNKHCDSESLRDGRSAVNGFPYSCPRSEGQLINGDESFVNVEMDIYRPVAIINRFDVRGQNFSDCGEHRVIFARDFNHARTAGRSTGRNFLIFEARMPNAMPGFASGCNRIAKFWTDLSLAASNDEQASLINAFYLQGIDGLPPVISIEHYAFESGQIRTNQFVDFSKGWLLREYKLDHQCSENTCTALTSVAVRAKDAFFAELFNPTLPSSASEFAARAGLFQREFIDNIESLLTHNMADIKVMGADQFTQAESHASGILTNESHFVNHFNNGISSEETSEFEAAFDAAIEGRVDASGNPLTKEQVLNRAMTQTCGGCHQPSTFGLTRLGALGDMIMPDGSIQSTWPFSAGFVHFSEFSDEATSSTALNELFLPARFNDLKSILTDIQ